MKLRTLIHLYGWRLRAHPLQELLAGAGIAVGVALLFAVQLANTSITDSVQQLLRGIVGTAQLEVTAGDEHGFGATQLARIERLSGVEIAAPLLERRAIVEGPRGEQPTALFGVEPSLAELGGRDTENFTPGGLRLPERGIALPERVARAIGVTAREHALLRLGGRAERVRVAAIVDEQQIGAISSSPLAIATLSEAQRLAGMRGRITSIYVKAAPGRTAEVRDAIERLADGRLSVAPADAVVRRLRLATEANDQSTALFSALSAMVGALFAFNAMLLTVPERRRFVADLRTQGATNRQIVAALAFQAVALGVAGSAAGLVLGGVLARGVFDGVPGYLAFTFPIGPQQTVPWSAVAIAVGCGMTAALLATCRPLADLRSRRDVQAPYDESGEPGEAIGPRLRWSLLGAGVVLVALVALVTALAPSTSIVAILALSCATLLMMPALYAGATWAVERLALRARLRLLSVAVLSAGAATTRSVAVAAIAAVAVLGNVTLGGAREDLVAGLHAGYADHLRTADVWVTTAGRSLTTASFRLPPETLRRVERQPGVAAARVYRGGMFDTGSRRIWLIGRPPGDDPIVPPSQLIEGSPTRANELIRRGGWAAVSDTIADERGVGVGDRLALPTPTGPLELRVAAVIANLGWSPGAIVLDAGDYARAWRTADPTAIEIDLAPGADPGAVTRAVTAALGPSAAALDVQTTVELEHEFRDLLQEGLARLNQISTLLLIASGLALAAVMSAAVWERRRLLATYKLEGVRRRQLAGMLVLEALVVLGVGCAAGVVAGVYGHLLVSHWLELTTGFTAPFSVQLGQIAGTLLAVLAGALAFVFVPGWLATRVPARLRFQQ